MNNKKNLIKLFNIYLNIFFLLSINLPFFLNQIFNLLIFIFWTYAQWYIQNNLRINEYIIVIWISHIQYLISTLFDHSDYFIFSLIYFIDIKYDKNKIKKRFPLSQVGTSFLEKVLFFCLDSNRQSQVLISKILNTIY